MVQITIEAEPTRICPGCDDEVPKGDEVALYECPQCSTQFDRDGSADGESHRCPDCNVFSARQGDAGPCGCAEELEAAFLIQGANGDEILVRADEVQQEDQ